jgi:hypothetical protein
LQNQIIFASLYQGLGLEIPEPIWIQNLGCRKENNLFIQINAREKDADNSADKKSLELSSKSGPVRFEPATVALPSS